jgi:tetratricopeptide (TPR) repeat protein
LLIAYIDRRQGRFAESLKGFFRALDLDPHNPTILQQISLSYQHQRSFTEMAAILDREIAIAPDDIGTRIQRAQVDLEARADTKSLRRAIESAVATDPAVASSVAEPWLYLALCERDPVEAERLRS